MGKYLVNQTFAAEWGFPLDRGPDDVIPNDLSDPNLQDGWLPPVSRRPPCSAQMVIRPGHKLSGRHLAQRQGSAIERHCTTA